MHSVNGGDLGKSVSLDRSLGYDRGNSFIRAEETVVLYDLGYRKNNR